MTLFTISGLRQALQAGQNAPAGGSDGRVEARFHAQVEATTEKQTRDGKPFWEVTLADAEAKLTLRAWSDSPMFALCEGLASGAFLEVEGEFGLHPAFGVESRRWDGRELEPQEVERLLGGPEPLREKQARDFAAITDALAAIADPRLHALCQLFLHDFGDRFRRAAAARTYHHARRGGLVEHAAAMVRAAVALAGVYPQLNRDLLVAGAFLHDIGKLWENCPEPRGFGIPYNERGELIGHIALGIEVINALWRKLFAGGGKGDAPVAMGKTPAPAEGPETATTATQAAAADGAAKPDGARPATAFTLPTAEELARWARLQPPSESVRNHLLHLIAAHHGEMQFGSPVLPKTPEAIALHYIDNLDAKLEMMAAAYQTGTPLAPTITERVRPLPANLVTPLGKFAPEGGGTAEA